MFPLTGPPALTVNIMKNTENSSIVVQWDIVDDSLITTYIVTWSSERDHITHHVTLTEQSSLTINGLTLDTVYTLTVSAANRCGQGPEYRTSVLLTTNTTSTMAMSVISTAGIIPITFTSSVNYVTTTAIINLSAATTTTAMINLDTTSSAAATTSSAAATTTVTNIVIISYVTPTSTARANPVNTTTADITCKF